MNYCSFVDVYINMYITITYGYSGIKNRYCTNF